MAAETAMTDAIRFLQEYVERDHAARYAKLTEPDDKKFIAKVHALDELFEGNRTFRSGVSRPVGEASSVYKSADYQAGAAALQPMKIMLVHHYDHPTRGDVFGGWLSDTEEGPRGLGLAYNVFVQPVKGKWLVVSRYAVCFTCWATGKVKGKKCGDCDIGGWEFAGGYRFKALGELVETRKLLAPTDKHHQAAYDAA